MSPDLLWIERDKPWFTWFHGQSCSEGLVLLRPPGHAATAVGVHYGGPLLRGPGEHLGDVGKHLNIRRHRIVMDIALRGRTLLYLTRNVEWVHFSSMSTYVGCVFSSSNHIFIKLRSDVVFFSSCPSLNFIASGSIPDSFINWNSFISCSVKDTNLIKKSLFISKKTINLWDLHHSDLAVES